MRPGLRPQQGPERIHRGRLRHGAAILVHEEYSTKSKSASAATWQLRAASCRLTVQAGDGRSARAATLQMHMWARFIPRPAGSVFDALKSSVMSPRQSWTCPTRRRLASISRRSHHVPTVAKRPGAAGPPGTTAWPTSWASLSACVENASALLTGPKPLVAARSAPLNCKRSRSMRSPPASMLVRL